MIKVSDNAHIPLSSIPEILIIITMNVFYKISRKIKYANEK
jgi:hypothetical protein